MKGEKMGMEPGRSAPRALRADGSMNGRIPPFAIKVSREERARKIASLFLRIPAGQFLPTSKRPNRSVVV